MYNRAKRLLIYVDYRPSVVGLYLHPVSTLLRGVLQSRSENGCTGTRHHRNLLFHHRLRVWDVPLVRLCAGCALVHRGILVLLPLAALLGTGQEGWLRVARPDRFWPVGKASIEQINENRHEKSICNEQMVCPPLDI